MKYILTLAAILTLFSCVKEREYRCECVGKRGIVLLKYDEKRDEAKGGLAGCEMVQDSFTLAAPKEEAHCYLYNRE